MTPWATPDDVRSRWLHADPLPADPVVVRWLDDAADHLETEMPGIADRIEEGEVPRSRVARVLAQMVMRVLINPAGIRQEQTGEGPFTGGVTFAERRPGVLYVTDDERALLDGRPTRGRGVGLASIDPYAGRWS